MRIAPCILFLLFATFGSGVAETKRVLTEKTPYFMCFAYTEDGMHFAGGDYDLSRAKKMIRNNCGLPKQIGVVLVKTIQAAEHGKVLTYRDN